MAQKKSRIGDVLQKSCDEILNEWNAAQLATEDSGHRFKGGELKEQSREFLDLFRQATLASKSDDLAGAEWDALREQIASVSKSRAAQGFSASEAASFIFSLKQPLFTRLRAECGKDADALETEIWAATKILDQLGLLATEAYQKAREAVIVRQQQDMLELSTPVVKLWDSVLAVPLIGTLDSARTQVVMESLLQEIVETESEIAIIDITGVPTVDTLVAQHLLKTIAATRLMGAECIISGIRPSIAQTIVHLGVELGDVTTKATLADAFALALARIGLTVGPK